MKTFFNQTIADLVGETGYTTNPKVLTSLWSSRSTTSWRGQARRQHPVGGEVQNYYVYTKKLHGLSYISLAAIFDKGLGGA